MSDVLFLYLFTRLDDLRVIFHGFGILAILGVPSLIIALVIKSFCEEDDEIEVATKVVNVAKVCVAIGFVFLVLKVLTPNKTDMAIIVGGKVTLDAARSETGQEVAGEVMDAIRAQLKEAAK